jgi:preprotein translocase subunit SecG
VLHITRRISVDADFVNVGLAQAGKTGSGLTEFNRELRLALYKKTKRRNHLKRITLLLIVAMLASPLSIAAQTRKRTTKSTKHPSAAAAAQQANEVKTAGATRVADQIKFLTKFIYLLGGIANGLAMVDEAARRNEASPEVVKKNEQSKATVRSSITGFRESLDKLEIDFRGTPELQPYYIKLAGVAAGAATAEQQAVAGQFDASGRSLLAVVNRLTDVLLLMRQ